MGILGKLNVLLIVLTYLVEHHLMMIAVFVYLWETHLAFRAVMVYGKMMARKKCMIFVIYAEVITLPVRIVMVL